MKIVTLLRHAKSSWNDDVARDLDRPLNAKGHRAAETVGAHLKHIGLGWDAAIASPAVRVAETIKAFEAGYGRAAGATSDRRVYMADAATLLDVIHELPASTDSVLLIGHNPGLEDLVFMLTPADENPYRLAVDEKYPTATVCQMRFDVDAWDEVEEGGGTIALLVRPRDLDPQLGPDS
ncbi:SixA phosphatase family protein [Pacificimonas flava]|uniref:Putative phosphohistidine phosphatase, SixA n=1 Tax=Pacificimonas flava TaxID=1234595 RepID=M2U771_9SPHN|nr:histidine phosphatase family protein [Pacificimonas flava]EMD83852.1 putative phosphohistidine phosphatase, SixA [Pacificimonas flava]MBB5281170.1 phosphohistidine phosphatase [Pacificimonas flava]